MASPLLIGITEGGVMNTDQDPRLDLDSRFRMVKEAGVYDYYDKTPSPADVDDYLAASEKYDLPILAGGWFYRIGQDEALLKQNLEIGARLGSKVHNTQILMDHAEGHRVSDEEVAVCYLQAAEWGEHSGCLPTFEVHINMWSEDFRRVIRVADLVEQRGVPFRMTLDHSHVIYKINNPEEQAVCGIQEDVESGDLVLDPFQSADICSQWIERGLIWHTHARSAVPNNPKNLRAKHPDGTVGRGVQYPFIEPAPGQYDEVWTESRLESWKQVMRNLLKYHANTAQSPLGQISTEFIPNIDYGQGYGYSLFDNSVACAKWLRSTWENEAGQVRTK
jgi:sugar phosphate isomerase/epimerase